jgi:CSLREA domain-containing protein
MRTLKCFLLIALIVFVGSAFRVNTLRAEGEDVNLNTIQVTTNADEYDTNGTGAGCSLREAVTAANTDAAFGGCNAGSGKDKIMLQDKYYLFERPETDNSNSGGDLDLTTPMILQGQGRMSTILDANAFDRVFNVWANGVKISGVKITGGGNVQNGGGVLVAAQVTLQDVYIYDNVSTNNGGGIMVSADGNLTLLNSMVEENRATISGGGIENHGTLTVRNSRLYRNRVTNSGSDGGGIMNYETATVRDSTLDANHAEGDGGGIYNFGTLNVLGSTLNGNNIYGDGGGIYNTGDMVIERSTLSGNTAYGSGGGISAQNTATTKLYNVTVASNYADFDSGNNGSGGGIHNAPCVNNCNVIEMHNSLLGNNKLPISNTNSDTQGYFTFAGEYNFIEAPGGQYIGDITHLTLGQDPALASLSNNGGATNTHALQSNSPAIDKGNPAGCRDANGNQLLTDQRGESAPHDGDGLNGPRCDVGAFELPLSSSCAAKPNKPAITQPANMGGYPTNQLTIIWGSAHCAETFQLIVKQGSKQGTTMVNAKDLRVLEYETPIMKKGKDYYARVKACNSFGCTKSAWVQFRLAKN